MADIAPFYNAGTVTIAAGSAALVGAGTSWATASGNIVPIRAGDIFMAPSGVAIPVLSVTDDTHITLAANWPGAALNASAYWIMYMTDGARVTAALNSFLAATQASALQALAGVAPAADTMPAFTGPNSGAAISVPSIARSFLAANFMAVQQGGGTGQGATNKLYLGWNAGSTGYPRLQVDTVDTGRIWSDWEAARSLAQTGFQAFPGGVIKQWGTSSQTGPDYRLNFPTVFPNACWGVFFSHSYDYAGLQSQFMAASTSNVNATGFDVRCRQVLNGGTVSGITSLPIYWEAIGN